MKITIAQKKQNSKMLKSNRFLLKQLKHKKWEKG